MLAASGALGGTAPTMAELLALDWAAVLVARFLAARHEDRPEAAHLETGLTLSVVDEWFPVRPIAAETIARAGVNAVDALDSWSALVLAEQLQTPLFTASSEVFSNRIEILHPW